MSGIDPGRPKIEERGAEYIWIGTRLLTPVGVEWTVYDIDPKIGDDGRFTLFAKRDVGAVAVASTFRMLPSELIRCRVEPEDR